MPLKLREGVEKMVLMVYPVLPEDASRSPAPRDSALPSGLQLQGCNDLSWIPWRCAITYAYVFI